MKTLCVVLLVTFGWSAAWATSTETPRSYWETKKRVIQENLKHENDTYYVAQDVIYDEKAGVLVVPKADAFKRVFAPEDPQSNAKGMVMRPNIDPVELRSELQFINQKLGASL